MVAGRCADRLTRARYEGLWVVPVAGGPARQRSDAPGAGFGFAWAPDGTALVARTARVDGLRRFHRLTRIDATTGAATALTEERASLPALPQWAGPRHVALYADGALDVIPLDDAARTQAPQPAVIAAGSALAVAGAGGLRTVRDEGAPILNLAPSPDGRRVAYEVYGGGLVVVDLADGTRIDLGPGSRPSWSPDGAWVVAQVTADDGHAITASDLVAVRSDGSDRVALTQTPGRLEMNPAWSPDGTRIAFDDAESGALYLLPVSR